MEMIVDEYILNRFLCLLTDLLEVDFYYEDAYYLFEEYYQ